MRTNFIFSPCVSVPRCNSGVGAVNFNRRLIASTMFCRCLCFAISAMIGTLNATELALDLDHAHTLAARATGFGFTIKEVSYPARCLGENQARGNLIALGLESDRGVAWADIVCGHNLFENRALQNGWTLLRFDVKQACLVRQGDAWKPLPDENCEVRVSRPAIAGTSLATSVNARLKGSGPLAAQERRLEITYFYTIQGPADRSPWSTRR